MSLKEEWGTVARNETRLVTMLDTRASGGAHVAIRHSSYSICCPYIVLELYSG